MARVVFFAFDIAEAAQLRRIGSIRALGHRVASVSFRRDNMRAGVGPDWPNLDLGPSSNNRYLLRLLRLGRAALRLWRGRDILGMSDVWIARNLDMVLLAVLMRRVSGQRQVRLVYECLDIHGLFTRADAVGAAMRWVERRMLARCDLLILSSPGFLDAYFRPVQGIRDAGRDAGKQALGRGEPAAPPRTPAKGGRRCPLRTGLGRIVALRPQSRDPGRDRARAWPIGRDRLPRRGAPPRVAGVRRPPGSPSQHPPRRRLPIP
jgi:hypothetical protein